MLALCPIEDAPGGRRWGRGHRRHPIAGLKGDPVAVPATAKLSDKRNAMERLFLLPLFPVPGSLVLSFLGPVFFLAPCSWFLSLHSWILASSSVRSRLV